MQVTTEKIVLIKQRCKRTGTKKSGARRATVEAEAKTMEFFEKFGDRDIELKIEIRTLNGPHVHDIVNLAKLNGPP
ncbi:hypothetical protein Tco_1153809 [Tanacetum coccineum]